jgi:hypothetical protein
MRGMKRGETRGKWRWSGQGERRCDDQNQDEQRAKVIANDEDWGVSAGLHPQTRVRRVM